MNKLTAEDCKILINGLSGNRSIREDKYLAALVIALPILEQQERGEVEWIEWGGGGNPAKESVVDVKLRDGFIDREQKAKGYRWNHIGSGTDIIAYRIIPERATNQNGEQ